MTGVRNGPLVRYLSSSSGDVQIGQVPAGLTWLVKTVHLWNISAAQSGGRVQMNSPDNALVAIVTTFDLEPNANVTWEGWTAMGPGDRLYLTADAGIFVWVAGAELPGAIP